MSAQEADPEAEALSATGIAGEILDTAIEHCRRGERLQALSLFEAMRAQLAPPPAILRLIEDLEATGCGPQTAATGGLRLHAGAGWDSNVTQGITARSIIVGSGGNAIELELDATYLPRPSAFAHATVDYSLEVPGTGVTLQASAGHRKNASEPEFDLSTVAASGSREFKFSNSIVRAQFDLGEIWLGGRHYQRTRGLGLQGIWATSLGTWVASFSAIDIDYLTQRLQNSLLTDAGLLLERRLNASLTVSAGLSLQHDKARNARPGGDRPGFQVQVGAFVATGGWQFRPYLTYARWESEDVFAPGLLDVHRRNALTQVLLQAEKPLTRRSSVVFEWRGRRARDTVVLYSYNAQVFTTFLVHRF